MKTKIIFALLVILLNRYAVLAQDQKKSISCMFYNLENMFYPSDDPLLEPDNDFTPEGERRWTFYRYHKKVTQICKVILASNGWEVPDIISLCELEEWQVLKDIVNHPLLMKNEYAIIHRDSPDHRGIDVAILYRKNKVICIDTSWLSIMDKFGKPMKTREILCATFLVGRDTILVVANHWISKYGGALETEEKRVRQACILGTYLDSLVHFHPGYIIIAGGDFNDGSEERSVQTLTASYSLTEIQPEKGECTYKYRGKWESIDHVFIGGRVLSAAYSAKVVSIPFLLEKDEKYTGLMPRRTYRGYAYNGGVSDHLPLLLNLDLMKH